MDVGKKLEKVKLGRPRQGKEVKIRKSIRIEPRKESILVKKYGSFQRAFDAMLRKEVK